MCLSSQSFFVLMQTFPSSETVLLASNSPPMLRNPGDDVDIDFGDVFGGPPKRRSKAKEVTRHSFNETALRRRDVLVDDSALIPRDAFSDGRDEKPVFGEESLGRRRFTTDDFFDDIFRLNEKKKNEPESSGSSLPGSRILSPAQKPESPGTSFPAQFSLPAKLMKATEIPTFGSATRSLSKNKETFSSSPLSRTSSKADIASPDVCVDAPKVVDGKGRQFHFSIYKWPNKGVPVVIWGSSRLSSMAKAEETTPSELQPTSVEVAGKDGESGLSALKEEKKTLQKRRGVEIEEKKTETGSFSGDMSNEPDVNVKPRRSVLDDKADTKGGDIVTEREVRKGKSKTKSSRGPAVDSISKKKPQGRRSSLDSSIPEKSSFASSSSVPEAGKDGSKGKVKDFVKIFSQGASVGTSKEPLGRSSRWSAKEVPRTDVNQDGVNAKETVNIPDQQKKSTPDIPTMDRDQRPSQATQKKDSDRESLKNNKRTGVFEQEKRREQSTANTTSEDVDEPFHVNFLVEEITQDEIKLEESRNNAEEIQNMDAKIRKWSSGKSGNIRSLLSTLQYILWPGSGWKAVPLMDMIEGNAVRKSYQRALLILHPDKLQQKGASANQKYMAEKVFELLQEAWDHFNTLGPV